jgi:hypothetical protein
LYYPTLKATYIASDTSIAITITHFHGSYINLLAEKKEVDAKWYTISELRNMAGIDDFDDYFVRETATCSVNGNTLTLTSSRRGGTDTFTKIK